MEQKPKNLEDLNTLMADSLKAREDELRDAMHQVDALTLVIR